MINELLFGFQAKMHFFHKMRADGLTQLLSAMQRILFFVLI
jgi:hypothetical protein